jgi:GT2 family glycosyltransferase
VRFSVVMPTLRRKEILRETLEEILAAEPPPHEVLVVDADGGGDVVRLLDELEPVRTQSRLRYINTAPSLTHQRNVGIDEAEGDVLVFLDDDVSIPTDLFDRLERAYDDESVVGVTGQVVEPESGRIGGVGSPIRRLVLGRGPEGTFTSFGYPRYISDPAIPRDVEWMAGCFMTARRDAARAVRFDEQLTGYALAEDEDFSYRLSRIGRIRYVPEIVVLHHKLGFTSKNPRDFNRLVVRNRTYLFRKNFAHTRRAKVRFALFFGVLFGHRLVNREWQAAHGLLDGAEEVLRRRAKQADRTAVGEGEDGAVWTKYTP